MMELYMISKQGAHPTLVDFSRSLIELLPYFPSSIFVVLDGLDEMEERQREEMVAVIDQLQKRLRVFVTTRPDLPGARRSFRSGSKIMIKGDSESLTSFLCSKMATVPLEPGLKERILKKLTHDEYSKGRYVTI
jgi:hypothetical protein